MLSINRSALKFWITMSSQAQESWTVNKYSALKTWKRAVNNKIATNNRQSASQANAGWYESKSTGNKKPPGSSNSQRWRWAWMLRSHRHSNSPGHNFILSSWSRNYALFFSKLFFRDVNFALRQNRNTFVFFSGGAQVHAGFLNILHSQSEQQNMLCFLMVN